MGRQGVAHAVDGDLPLLHGLQKRRLGFGRRPVDLVRQQEGCEDRATDQRKLVALKIEHVRASDVSRHQIRGELDTSELAAQYLCQRPHQQRFGNPRHAFDEGMLTGENDDERLLHDLGLPDDDLGDLLLRQHQRFFQVIHTRIHAIISLNLCTPESNDQ